MSHTKFDGELKFKSELTVTELAYLKSLFGEDCRDHPEWEKFLLILNDSDFYYINLRLLDDFSGIKWEQSEKTYDMVSQLNFITLVMRQVMPDFGLSGELICQGEDVEDRFVILMDENGFASSHKITFSGQKVTCPNCDLTFVLETLNES